MPSKMSREKKNAEEEAELAKSERKKAQTGKQISGGEASKRAKVRLDAEVEQDTIDVAEGQDNKRGNIGPSGQGGHRGRERRNRQSSASGRPDHSAASPGAPGT